MSDENTTTVATAESPADKIAQLKLQVEINRKARQEKLKLEAEKIELRKLEEELGLEELEAKHGLVGKSICYTHAVLTGDMVVLKRPNELTWTAFNDACNKGSPSTSDQENFVKGCLIYPSKDSFNAIQKVEPAIIGNAFATLSVLMSGLDLETAKTLPQPE